MIQTINPNKPVFWGLSFDIPFILCHVKNRLQNIIIRTKDPENPKTKYTYI